MSSEILHAYYSQTQREVQMMSQGGSGIVIYLDAEGEYVIATMVSHLSPASNNLRFQDTVYLGEVQPGCLHGLSKTITNNLTLDPAKMQRAFERLCRRVRITGDCNSSLEIS